MPAASQPEMICSRATALRFGKLISAVAGAERADAIVILRRQRAEMMTHVGGGKVPTLALFRTSTGFAQWGAIETIMRGWCLSARGQGETHIVHPKNGEQVWIGLDPSSNVAVKRWFSSSPGS